MIISSLSLQDFRNYEGMTLSFSPGTNILYGDNAQGKTNILEAMYLVATTKSHRGVRDRDMIRFGCHEAHIRTVILKKGLDYRVDLHLREGKSKGIAINGQRVKKASDPMGLLHIVFFSPEDLTIVKNGPAYRRHFLDMELGQLDGVYLQSLNSYNKVLENRNKLLKAIFETPSLKPTLDVWDAQLVDYGVRIIEERTKFLTRLNEVIGPIHEKLSGGKEHLTLVYEPNVTADQMASQVKASRDRDLYSHQTQVGPHKDDFSFVNDTIDLRRYGSQGQQRTCALSLKLSELRLVEEMTGDAPVLMLDDVLSELDSSRQNYLIESLGGIQTFITCTGLDEFVEHRFRIDSLYEVTNGHVTQRTDNEKDG